MPTYYYTAADQGGKMQKGEREAESEKNLARILKQEGLFLMEANEKSKVKKSFASLDVSKAFSRVFPIRLVEKMVFARNLSVMVAAGLPLTKALEALAKQTPNSKFQKIISELNKSVIQGRSFSDSLSEHEKVFGNLFINMVAAGEASGKLPLALRLIANQMKKDYELRRRVRGAMLYPVIILIVLFGIGIMMMVYVVPTLSQTIQELGVELPLTTRIVIQISNLLTNYALFVVLVAVGLIIAVWRSLKTSRGKRIMDLVFLKLPVIGNLVKEFNVARFCRTLAYLITSGVAIVKALEITSAVVGNSIFRKVIEDASREIQKGKQLNLILELHPELFEPVVIQMISVGEETGKISDMMLRLALFFEGNVSNTTKNFSTVIEPAIMIFIGIVVGFFAISMLQPIYGSLGNI